MGLPVIGCRALRLLLRGWRKLEGEAREGGVEMGWRGGRLEGEAAVKEAPEDKVLPVGQDMEAEAYPQHP